MVEKIELWDANTELREEKKISDFFLRIVKKIV